VLRFDWRGTGDSTGTLGEMRVADWLSDVAAVIAEGRDITGAGRVNLVGVRAGALFLCAALQGGPGVGKVVLWDPVPSGADYVGQLRRIQDRMLGRNRYMSRADRRLAAQEVGGQRMSVELRRDVEALDAGMYSELRAGKCTAIVTDEASAFEGTACERRLIRFNCNWETDSEDIMLPQPVLSGVRACLVEA
jgi:pimeloyl-ACP methyl ester carboxylesterase